MLLCFKTSSVFPSRIRDAARAAAAALEPQSLAPNVLAAPQVSVPPWQSCRSSRRAQCTSSCHAGRRLRRGEAQRYAHTFSMLRHWLVRPNRQDDIVHLKRARLKTIFCDSDATGNFVLLLSLSLLGLLVLCCSPGSSSYPYSSFSVTPV